MNELELVWVNGKGEYSKLCKFENNFVLHNKVIWNKLLCQTMFVNQGYKKMTFIFREKAEHQFIEWSNGGMDQHNYKKGSEKPWSLRSWILDNSNLDK